MSKRERAKNNAVFHTPLSATELRKVELRTIRIRFSVFTAFLFIEGYYWVSRIGFEGMFSSQPGQVFLAFVVYLPLRLVFYLAYYRRHPETPLALAVVSLFAVADAFFWALVAALETADFARLLILFLFMFPLTAISQLSLNVGYTALTGLSFGLSFIGVVLVRFDAAELIPVDPWGHPFGFMAIFLLLSGLGSALLCQLSKARYIKLKAYQTLLRKQRDSLSRNQNALRGFYARVTHELRTPLHGIIGMSGLLAESVTDSDEAEYVRSIRINAEALLGLINNILDKSKIEAGYFLPEIRTFPLADALELVKSNIRHAIGERPVDLEVTVEDGVPEVLRGDQSRLLQILFNLLGNAAKFTHRGKIVLAVRALGSGSPAVKRAEAVDLEFTVSDTGIGIAPEILGRIFDEYVQGGSSDFARGTGIGLTITKELVEALGGTIAVRSEPGVGSSFTVVLPFGSARGTEIQQSLFEQEADAAAGIIHIRILIVDDNQTNRFILDRMVTKAGGTAVLADSGERCLQLVRETEYDLIFMDFEMPDVDGVEVIRRIRGIERSLGRAASKIVLITGHGKEIFSPESLEDVYALVQKPVRLFQIRELMKECRGGENRR